MSIKYNQKSKSCILQYAYQLRDKTLSEILGDTSNRILYGGKGSFGQLVEEEYFGYKINSISEPDFKEVGLELKCSPLKENKNGEYRAKERLVLNIINYLNIVNENFETSSFWNKNANLLLIFYLYEREKLPVDFIIKLVEEWSFNDADLEIIKRDWETIVNKVRDGKAHELSEGDTFYLGACTKGANANSVRNQPFSEIQAKQRAFSLKPGYVNHIIASIAGSKKGYGKLISDVSILKTQSIEEYVIKSFEKYHNRKVEDILLELNVDFNTNAKNFTSSLMNALLGMELNDKIEEFEKAEIIIKTVRLKANNLPCEDISFPNFKYTDIINEDWEESDFKNVLEHKFLFFFLKYIDGVLYFDKAVFWNMNYQDRVEAKRVWDYTKEIVGKGQIVKEITEKGTRKTNFPSKKYSHVAHVRPHARDAADAFELPVKDQYSGLTSYTKHCFWLNAKYVKDEIFMKS